VREEEANFKASAAEGCNLLPLKRCIFSDHLTPVLAYRCLVKEDDREAPSFLFESVEQGSEGTNVVCGIFASPAPPLHPQGPLGGRHFIEHVISLAGEVQRGRGAARHGDRGQSQPGHGDGS
jgi:hypothetical protein